MINGINFQLRKELKKLKIVFLLTIITVLLSSSFATNSVFATHLSEEIKWQLLFISSKACSIHNFQMMTQYDEISEKYLELYSLENTKYEPICISQEKYLSDYEVPHDLDLIILVYDRELGEQQLHSQKMGGLYSHTGSDRNYNHVIILCDCSNFYYSDPVWILSHELAHFILYYRNYEMSVIEDLIHANDAEYDKCIKGGSVCDSIVKKISIDSSSRIFSVMPIFDTKKIENLQNSNYENIQSSFMGLTKMITKWWASDKITDGDYANAIGYLVEQKFLPLDTTSGILIADDPLDETETWEDLYTNTNSNAQNRFTDDLQNTQTLEKTLTTDGKLKPSLDEVILGLPDWFKTTAGWWSQGKVSDEEFKRNIHFLVKNGILRSHTSDIFKVVIDEDSLLERSLKELKSHVQFLIDSENLEKSDGQKLINQLDKAVNDFYFYETFKACAALDNFIERVSLFVDENKIPQIQGQSLINGVDLVKFNFCY